MKSNDLHDFYDTEAATYESRRYGGRYGQLFRVAHRSIVRKILAGLPRMRFALDVASGTGQMLPPLAERCECLVASDLTKAMLTASREAGNAPASTNLCLADASCLPFADDSLDMVSSSRFLHLFPIQVQDSMVGEMSRLLRQDGVLIVDFYNPLPRKVLLPAIWVYRTLLRKRPEEDFYVDIASARRIIEKHGLHVEVVVGIGSYFAAPFVWLSSKALGRIVEKIGSLLPALSEQFVVVARKL